MIDLNRKAFQDILEQHFQAAKYRLSEAMVISETAGLENDEMTARTFVHLAAVYLTGLKDREEAIKQFTLALKINPNITITPGLESPALKSAYLQAREQLELPPNPDSTAPATAPQPPSPQPSSPTVSAKGMNVETGGAQPLPGPWNESMGMVEPDLPARIPAPLYCNLPFDTQPGQDVVVRCLTQKQTKRSEATIHYRPQGADSEFATLPMVRSPKGWLVVVIPGRAAQGASLSYYVQAQIPGVAAPLFLGHPEAPRELLIHLPPEIASAEESEDEPTVVPAPAHFIVPGPGEAPRPSRLRAPGSLWIALAGGTGAAYHGHGTVDSHANIGGTSTPVSVQSGFSAASLFQIEPEIGYQVTRRWSVSVLARYQYAPKEVGVRALEPGENSVPTSAFAGFARGQFAFFNRGGLQTYASGGAGFGASFLAVVNKRCGATSCSLKHSDTLQGGPVGLMAGIGAIYHFAPSFGVFVDVKEIATLPKVMALTEVNVGVAFARRFQGSDSSKQAGTTRRVSWR